MMKNNSSRKLKLIKMIIFWVMVLTTVQVNQKADAHAIPLATDGVHINDVVTYMNTLQQSNFTHDDIHGLLNQITTNDWRPLVVDSSLNLAGNVINVHFNQNVTINGSDNMRISYDGGPYQPLGLRASYYQIGGTPDLQLKLDYSLNYNITSPIKLKILGGSIRDATGRLYLQDIVTNSITPSIVVSPGSQYGSIDLKVDPTVVGTVYYKQFDYLSATPTDPVSIVEGNPNYFTTSAIQTATITDIVYAHPYQIAVVIQKNDSSFLNDSIYYFTVLTGSLPIAKIQSYIVHGFYYDQLTIADLKHAVLEDVVIDDNFKVYQNMLRSLNATSLTETTLTAQIKSENEVAPINKALLTAKWYRYEFVKLDVATLKSVLNKIYVSQYNFDVNLDINDSNFDTILSKLTNGLYMNENINLTKDKILGIIADVIHPPTPR